MVFVFSPYLVDGYKVCSLVLKLTLLMTVSSSYTRIYLGDSLFGIALGWIIKCVWVHSSCRLISGGGRYGQKVFLFTMLLLLLLVPPNRRSVIQRWNLSLLLIFLIYIIFSLIIFIFNYSPLHSQSFSILSSILWILFLIMQFLLLNFKISLTYIIKILPSSLHPSHPLYYSQRKFL